MSFLVSSVLTRYPLLFALHQNLQSLVNDYYHYYYFIKALRGALGVTVIVLGNGIGDPSSNPGCCCLRFTER